MLSFQLLLKKFHHHNITDIDNISKSSNVCFKLNYIYHVANNNDINLIYILIQEAVPKYSKHVLFTNTVLSVDYNKDMLIIVLLCNDTILHLFIL